MTTKQQQDQDHSPTAAEIKAAVRTLQRAARDGLRITITLESAPNAVERAYSRPEAWVRALREKLRMTQDDLAMRLEVSTRAIRRREQGESVPKRRRTIRILNDHARDHGMPPLPLPLGNGKTSSSNHKR